jgi:hypothetical protein
LDASARVVMYAALVLVIKKQVSVTWKYWAFGVCATDWLTLNSSWD